jgi:hypothetical protein
MFLQIGKRCTPFSALHQSFPTLPIILGSSGRKTFFCKIHEAGSLKLDINVHLPKTRAYLQIDTNFDPPWFLLDNTFKVSMYWSPFSMGYP